MSWTIHPFWMDSSDDCPAFFSPLSKLLYPSLADAKKIIEMQVLCFFLHRILHLICLITMSFTSSQNIIKAQVETILNVFKYQYCYFSLLVVAALRGGLATCFSSSKLITTRFKVTHHVICCHQFVHIAFWPFTAWKLPKKHHPGKHIVFASFAWKSIVSRFPMGAI